MAVATFNPGKASPVRWIIDSIERALLGVTPAGGAAHPFAVALGPDRVRVPDADSADPDPANNAPGRVIGEAAALQRGYAICHVSSGASEVQLPLSDPAQFYEMRVHVTIQLPAPAFWPARSRSIDLIDRVCNDCIAAVMADPRRESSGEVLAENTWCESSHEPLEGYESMEEEAALCTFVVRHRRRHNDPQYFAPDGLPLLGEPIEAFSVYADGPLAATFLESEQGVVRLRYTPIDTETVEVPIGLAGLTVAGLIAALDAIDGLTVINPEAAVAGVPATDLLPFAETPIDGLGQAVPFVVEA